jgi:hypothetical protein
MTSSTMMPLSTGIMNCMPAARRASSSARMNVPRCGRKICRSQPKSARTSGASASAGVGASSAA